MANIKTTVYLQPDLKAAVQAQGGNISQILTAALNRFLENTNATADVQGKEKIAQKEKDKQYTDFIHKTDSAVINSGTSMRFWALKTGRSIEFLTLEKFKHNSKEAEKGILRRSKHESKHN